MDRIKELRIESNKNQTKIAKAVNVSQQSFANYESGKTQPPFEVLKDIANYFNVSIDYLLGVSNERRSKGVKIPVLGTIPAGIPIEAIENIIDYEEISEELAKQGEFFALKVRGDSMSPNIKDGDILIVKKQEDATSGDICVVMVNGYDSTVKRIKKDNTGIVLIPDNQNYNNMFYSNSDIASLPVRIIGKVIEIRRSIL